MEIFEYTVSSETEGMRLDRYLRKICKNEPLSKIFQALRKGDIKINGKKSKENYRLCSNDIIIVKNLNVEKIEKEVGKTKKTFLFDKNKYKKIIIFENDDFFIINKPGNIPMHKGTGHKFGLSEIFKEIYGNNNINFANRLDYETSGLVIGCKTMKFLRYISEKIRNNEVQKKYMAIIEGVPEKEEFTIESFLKVTENGVIQTENKNDREAKKSITKFKKIESISLGIKETNSLKDDALKNENPKSTGAENIGLKNTNSENVNKNFNTINIGSEKSDIFSNLKKDKNFLSDVDINLRKNGISLLDIELITGRKHQIRVQLSNIGHSIIGDRKYGKSRKESKLYLCCYSLSFDKYNFKLESKNDYFK